MVSKVILINSLTSGGAERVAINLAKSDENFTIITLWPEVFYSTSGLHVRSLLDKKGFIFFDLIKCVLKLKKIIRSHEIKVNSHLFWSNYVNFFASIFSTHTPTFTHCVSLKAKYSGSKIKFYFHYMLMSLMYKSKGKHIYKSHAMKTEYEKIFNATGGEVIYNPIDKALIEKKSGEPINFIFRKDCTYLLSVGRFHPTKGQMMLAQAMEFLPLHYHLIYLGDGQEMNNVQSYVFNQNLASRVHFLGKVDNPYPYYKHCDFYVSNSNAEGLPNALLEAIVIGTKIVHTDCYTGPREILTRFKDIMPRSDWKKGDFEICELGCLFNSNDINGFVNALLAFNEVKHSNYIIDKMIDSLNIKSISKCYSDVILK